MYVSSTSAILFHISNIQTMPQNPQTNFQLKMIKHKCSNYSCLNNDC